MVGQQLHGEARHGDIARIFDRMFAVDGDVEIALGHAEQVLMEVPEAKTRAIDKAGGHVGGKLGRARIRAYC